MMSKLDETEKDRDFKVDVNILVNLLRQTQTKIEYS